MQYAVVEYAATVKVTVTGGASQVGDTSMQGEPLNENFAFSADDFVKGTPWGELPTTLYAILKAILLDPVASGLPPPTPTPRPSSTPTPTPTPTATPTPTPTPSPHAPTPTPTATPTPTPTPSPHAPTPTPTPKPTPAFASAVIGAVNSVKSVYTKTVDDVVATWDSTANFAASAAKDTASFFSSAGGIVEHLAEGVANDIEMLFSQAWLDNVVGIETASATQCPIKGDIWTCLCTKAMMLNIVDKHGASPPRFREAQTLICTEQLWRQGTPPFDFSSELAFVGEDYAKGTLIDMIMVMLLHSVDHATGRPQDPASMKNSFYEGIAGNLTSPLDYLRPGDVTWGSPLWWCQPHTPVERETAAICMILNFDFDIPASAADDEYCTIGGLDGLNPASVASYMKAYAGRFLLADEAYGVIQACANNAGYMQVSPSMQLRVPYYHSL